VANKYQQVEIWWCSKCNKEWKCPSVPHRPECPECGTGGWWKRFLTQAEIQALNS